MTRRLSGFGRGAWERGETKPPASVWRWLEYGPVDNPLADRGRLQVHLEARGIRDPGSGSTLKTLEERGLIETRQKPAMIGYKVEVKLTTLGHVLAAQPPSPDARPLRRLQPHHVDPATAPNSGVPHATTSSIPGSTVGRNASAERR
ncbi:hypothetical protein [Nonomuraea sp. NPDC049784]|uniref:hypothetical protein n=1 Tax=Nonomuraea sp. NPDC049784 TaxID=3154361 RepID=UPI0033C82A5F